MYLLCLSTSLWLGRIALPNCELSQCIQDAAEVLLQDLLCNCIPIIKDGLYYAQASIPSWLRTVGGTQSRKSLTKEPASKLESCCVNNLTTFR